jgi:hypothetical protein
MKKSNGFFIIIMGMKIKVNTRKLVNYLNKKSFFMIYATMPSVI